MLQTLKNTVSSLFVLIVTTYIFWWLEYKLLESGYIEQRVVEIDGQRYLMPTFVMKKSDPRKITSLGNKLVFDSLNEIVGRKSEKNKYFDDVKSMVSKNGTYVDCYEENTKVAIDYLNEDYFKYDGPSHINNDFYDFYDRLAIDELKKEKLVEKGVNYIRVPYQVDICEVNEKGKRVCDKNTPEDIRKRRIKGFLMEKIKTNL